VLSKQAGLLASASLAFAAFPIDYDQWLSRNTSAVTVAGPRRISNRLPY